MTGPLPLKSVHHVELLVGNAKQAAFFYRTAFGFSQLAYAGPETGVRNQASYVLSQGDIRLLVSTPLTPEDPMSETHRLHGDGALDIAFLVDDVTPASRRPSAVGRKSPASRTIWPTKTDACVERSCGLMATRSIHSFRSTIIEASFCRDIATTAFPAPVAGCKRSIILSAMSKMAA